MTPKLDLDELERLHKAATPGPWITLSGHSCGPVEICRAEDGHRVLSRDGRMMPSDFALIIATVNALPELLRLARRAGRLERSAAIECINPDSVVEDVTVPGTDDMDVREIEVACACCSARARAAIADEPEDEP